MQCYEESLKLISLNDPMELLLYFVLEHHTFQVDKYDKILNDGFSYDAWHGYNILPRLNLRNPAVRNYLKDAIRFWVKEFDIDGIRLDTADVLDFDFFSSSMIKNSIWHYMNSHFVTLFCKLFKVFICSKSGIYFIVICCFKRKERTECI